jgi:hypothetical protein
MYKLPTFFPVLSAGIFLHDLIRKMIYIKRDQTLWMWKDFACKHSDFDQAFFSPSRLDPACVPLRKITAVWKENVLWARVDSHLPEVQQKIPVDSYNNPQTSLSQESVLEIQSNT